MNYLFYYFHNICVFVGPIRFMNAACYLSLLALADNLLLHLAVHI